MEAESNGACVYLRRSLRCSTHLGVVQGYEDQKRTLNSIFKEIRNKKIKRKRRPKAPKEIINLRITRRM